MQQVVLFSATILSLATLVIIPGGPTLAQSTTGAMTVTGYFGTQAAVQDPPGSGWKHVPTSTLPVNALVIEYLADQWVEINENGHPIRVNLSSVKTTGLPPPPDVVVCHPGTTSAASNGEQGFGGC